jgi:hypothetical protein
MNVMVLLLTVKPHASVVPAAADAATQHRGNRACLTHFYSREAARVDGGAQRIPGSAKHSTSIRDLCAHIIGARSELSCINEHLTGHRRCPVPDLW